MSASSQEVLGKIMKSLGNPVRIELLRQLAVPRQLSEIRVAPHRKEKGGAPNRMMSRASVQAHLEQLLEVGAVRSMAGVRDGRSVTLYAVDQRQLFALTEELSDLSRLAGAPEAFADGTAPAPMADAKQVGPRFVLMNGPWEGQTAALKGNGPWTIGRAATNLISLPYDPFLSGVNSEIRRGEFAYTLHNLPRSRNGTHLNWEKITASDGTSLVPGDVVGVGRTLLLFRRD